MLTDSTSGPEAYGRRSYFHIQKQEFQYPSTINCQLLTFPCIETFRDKDYGYHENEIHPTVT